jgi:hypothetical protein
MSDRNDVRDSTLIDTKYHLQYYYQKNFMKKIYVALLVTILIAVTSFAQKGKNFIGVGADLSLPASVFGEDFKRGIGVYVKAMLGVGEAGAVTVTTGYSAFKEIADYGDDVATTATIVPILLGYRHNFNGFFVEPQIGYALYPYKHESEDGFYTDTEGAFTWAAGIGYVFNNKIEVSARYQTANRAGYSVGIFGLRLGYNFSLGASK